MWIIADSFGNIGCGSMNRISTVADGIITVLWRYSDFRKETNLKEDIHKSAMHNPAKDGRFRRK